MRYKVLLVLLALIGLANAFTIGGQEYQLSQFFTKLVSNENLPCGYNSTNGYPKICSAEFILSNPLPQKLPLRVNQITFFDNVKHVQNDSIIVSRSLRIERDINNCGNILASTSLDCQPSYVTIGKNDDLNSNDKVLIRITANKSFYDEVDWKPKIFSTISDLGTGLDEMFNDWAIWKKGAEPTPNVSIGLKVLYHLEEASGTTITDSSGTGLTGTASSSNITYSQSGKLGNSLRFTTTGGASTEGGMITWSNATTFTNPTMCAWFKINSIPQHTGTDIGTISDIGQGVASAMPWNINVYQSNMRFSVSNATSAGQIIFATSPVTANTWYHACLVYNSATGNTSAWVNGSYIGSTLNARYNSSAGKRSIGCSHDWVTNPVYCANATIDEYRLYDKVLSEQEIQDLYFFTTPIAGYHMDEASGNIVDFTGNGYTGTPGGTLSYSKPGVFSNSINFAGTGNFTLGGTSTLNSQQHTILLWVNLTGAKFSCSSDDEIVAIKDAGAWAWSHNWGLGYCNSTGTSSYQNLVYLRGNAAGSGGVQVISSPISLNTWHHVALVTNDTKQMIFIDGVLNASATVSTQYIGSGNILMGSASGSTAEHFKGSIDEFKYFNRAFTPSEILLDYQSGILELNITSPTNNTNYASAGNIWFNTTVGIPGISELINYTISINGTVKYSGGITPTPSIANGIVGNYHMGEGSGNLQSSATNNYPMSTTGVVYTADGISGNAITFDTPSGDTANTTDSPTDLMIPGAFSVSLWVKPIALKGTNTFLYRGTNAVRNYAVYYSGGVLNFNGKNESGGSYRFSSACSITPPDNVWSNFIGVYNTTHSILYVNGSACNISTITSTGTADNRAAFLIIGSYYDGLNFIYGANSTIDEVRIYNRALLDAEAQDLYSFTSPIAIYHLNGNVNDVSGNAYNGAIEGGTVSESSTVFSSGYTVRNNGSALTTGNYDQIPIPREVGFKKYGSVSACAWGKLDGYATGAGTFHSLFSLGNSTAYGLLLAYSKTGPFFFRNQIGNSSGVVTILPYVSDPPVGWHHYCLTTDYTGNMSYFYMDGILANSTYVANPSVGYPTGNRSIGGHINTAGSKYYGWNGSIDEVVLYNRQLTSSEIKTLALPRLINSTHYELDTQEGIGVGRNQNVSVTVCGNLLNPMCGTNVNYFTVGTCWGPSVSGMDWLVDCSQNCQVSNMAIIAGNVTFDNTGSYLADNLNLTYQRKYVNTGCKLYKNSGSYWWLKNA